MYRCAYDGTGHHGFWFAEPKVCETGSVGVVQLCGCVRRGGVSIVVSIGVCECAWSGGGVSSECVCVEGALVVA